MNDNLMRFQFFALGFVTACFLFTVLCARGDDAELRATITRASYTRTDELKAMQKQIQDLADAGFQYSWTDPKDERGFVWIKYGPMPWVRVRAALSVEECETVRRLLKI